MAKKEMKLDFALDLLYQEATSEDTKYSQKQKETAYNVLKDNIYILKIIRKFVDSNYDEKKLSFAEREVLQEWLNK